MMKWITTEQATIELAKNVLAQRVADLPIWIRWYRTYNNPHGGGAFGKSKECCTTELVGVTPKRLKLKDYEGIHSVDPRNCYFAKRETR